MTERHGVRQARFDEVMALHGQGWPMKRIARTLGITRKTVRAWVWSGELLVWSQRDRGSAIDLHAVYLRQRWGDGCHNAARLWREIQERGFRGQLRTVQRWVHRLRNANPPSAGAVGTILFRTVAATAVALLELAFPTIVLPKALSRSSSVRRARSASSCVVIRPGIAVSAAAFATSMPLAAPWR